MLIQLRSGNSGNVNACQFDAAEASRTRESNYCALPGGLYALVGTSGLYLVLMLAKPYGGISYGCVHVVEGGGA